MWSCVGPIYEYLGSQLGGFFTIWTPFWATKQLEPSKPVDGSKHLQKQRTFKSNVTFKYKELQDATGQFCRKNLIGHGGFAKVRPSETGSIYQFKMINAASLPCRISGE